MKNIIIILAISLSFFLGRESKDVLKNVQSESSYNLDEFQLGSSNDFTLNAVYQLKAKDTVYRCGQSKIYHPTTAHASFKRCKSKVYKLTVERAKKLGMRHCKCSG